MIPEETLARVKDLVDEGKVLLDADARRDLLKHGYRFSFEFLKTCLKEGNHYSGAELYPDEPRRRNRLYCLHKHVPLSSRVLLIGYVLTANIIIIHICEMNPSSKEGKVYYSK